MPDAPRTARSPCFFAKTDSTDRATAVFSAPRCSPTSAGKAGSTAFRIFPPPSPPRASSTAKPPIPRSIVGPLGRTRRTPAHRCRNVRRPSPATKIGRTCRPCPRWSRSGLAPNCWTMVRRDPSNVSWTPSSDGPRSGFDAEPASGMPFKPHSSQQDMLYTLTSGCPMPCGLTAPPPPPSLIPSCIIARKSRTSPPRRSGQSAPRNLAKAGGTSAPAAAGKACICLNNCGIQDASFARTYGKAP